MNQLHIPRPVAIAVTALALAAGTAVPAAAHAPTDAAGETRAASVPVVTVQAGQPGLAARVDRSARTTTSGHPADSRPHGSRRLPSSDAARAGAAPSATPLTPSAARSALLRSFNGTSSRDSEVANFNAKFEPPDQGLCVGAGFVLEPVNSAYRIFRTDGRTVRGPFNVNEIFNEGGKEYSSDPRCWYDPTEHAWFATVLFLNDTFTQGRIQIAVNPSEDPTGLWTEYQIDATFDGRNGEPNLAGCPCFGDQPRIGIDQTNLYVTTDEFSINGPQYHGGQIYAIAKSDLVSAAPSAHFVRFGNLHLGGSLSTAPQPALSIGQPDAEYFLSQLDPTGAGDHRIGVWALTHRDRVANGGSPTLSKMVISSEGYVTPPAASQRGSTSKIDSGDDRMQQVSYVRGTVWGELGTGLRPAGESAHRAGAAWFQVRPRLQGAALAGATIVRQGYVASPGESLLYPALQPDAAGNAAMVFTLTGEHRYPSAGYAVLKSGGRQFQAPVLAAAGTGPYDPNGTRWGDYSFAVPDPASHAAWLATEYVPPPASQTSTHHRNWGTRVLKVRLG